MTAILILVSVDCGPTRSEPNTAIDALKAQVSELVAAGKPADAIAAARAALTTSERDQGPNDLQTGLILTILASLEQNQGRHAVAEAQLRRAFAIVRHEASGIEEPYADILRGLATAASALGRPEEATRLTREASAVNGFERLSRPVFETWQAQRVAEALPLAEAALVFAEKELGSDHPATATGHLNVGAQYDGMNRIAEAEASYKRALTILDASLGTDSASAYQMAAQLTALYARHNRFADADPLLRRLLAWQEARHGRESIEVASILVDVASSMEAQRRHAEALPYLLRALANGERAYGRGDARLFMIIKRIGNNYGVQNRHAESEPYLRRTLAMAERDHPKDDPEVAGALASLGYSLGQQKRYADSEPLFERAVAITEKT
jgi:tetratricopeptide (TPR) repeat protein